MAQLVTAPDAAAPYETVQSTGCEQSCHKKGAGKCKVVLKGNNTVVLARLERQLQKRTRQLHVLSSENAKLRSKEAVLFQTVTQTAHNVYYLAQVAGSLLNNIGQDSSDFHQQQVTDALLADIRAQQLLQQLGSSYSRSNSNCLQDSTAAEAAVPREGSATVLGSRQNSSSSTISISSPASQQQQQLTRTHRALLTAITPERVSRVQQMSLEQLAATARSRALKVQSVAQVRLLEAWRP